MALDPPLALARPSPAIAYFGPHAQHAQAIERNVRNVRLRRYDYFAPGYEYKGTRFADVQKIPLPRWVLDGLLVFHVLEHVPNLTLAANELRRVIKRGGLLDHETPCYGKDDPDVPDFLASTSAFECAKTERKDRICQQRDHLYAYRCEHIRRTFVATGFSTCRVAMANLSLADYMRFLSIGNRQMDLHLWRQRRGRFRCIK